MSKKWASNDRDRLLVENFRNFMAEGDFSPSLEEESKLEKVVSILSNPSTPLDQYVAILKRYAGDPAFDKLATSGDKDGDAQDEVVKVTRSSVPAKNLTATQAEIGFSNSLKDQMTNPPWNPVPKALGLDGEPIIMPSKENPPPAILVWNGKYILDGHHRWSQIMMMNPDGEVAIDNVVGPELDDEEEALKAMQLAIAAVADNVKTKPFKGQNLMNSSPEEVAKYVLENITDEVLEFLVKAGKIEKPDKRLAAKYVASNVPVIKNSKGKFSRERSMPQAGASGASQDAVNKALATGKINFDDPKLSDVGDSKLGQAYMKGTKSGFKDRKKS